MAATRQVDGERAGPDRRDPAQAVDVGLRHHGGAVREVNHPVRRRAGGKPQADRVPQRVLAAVEADHRARILGGA